MRISDSRMVKLIDLPVEIFIQIFEGITNEKDDDVKMKSFLAIARTSKVLNSIVTPFIYCDINSEAMKERFDAFKNALLMNPANAKHIRSVTAATESTLQFIVNLAPLALRRLHVKIL